MAEDGHLEQQTDSRDTPALRPLEGAALRARLAEAEVRREKALAERKARGAAEGEPGARSVLPKAAVRDPVEIEASEVAEPSGPASDAGPQEMDAASRRAAELLDAEAFQVRLEEARARRQAALERRAQAREGSEPAGEAKPDRDGWGTPAAKPPVTRVPGFKKAGSNPSNYTVVIEKLPDPVAPPVREPEAGRRKGLPVLSFLAVSAVAAICFAVTFYVFRTPIEEGLSEPPATVEMGGPVAPAGSPVEQGSVSVTVTGDVGNWTAPGSMAGQEVESGTPSVEFGNVLASVAPETEMPVGPVFTPLGDVPKLPDFAATLNPDGAEAWAPAAFEVSGPDVPPVDMVRTGLDVRPDVSAVAQVVGLAEDAALKMPVAIEGPETVLPEVMTLASLKEGSVSHPDRSGPVFPFLWRPDLMDGELETGAGRQAELEPKLAALIPHGSPEPLEGPRGIEENGGDLEALVDPAEVLTTDTIDTGVPDRVTTLGETIVRVHFPDSSGGAASGAVDLLRGSGVPDASAIPVNFSISQSNVRYYFAADRAAAEQIVEILNANGMAGDVRLRDFTQFRPSPTRGLVEVWLSGEPLAAAPTPAPAPSAAASQTLTAAEERRALEVLRLRRQAIVERMLRQQLEN